MPGLCSGHIKVLHSHWHCTNICFPRPTFLGINFWFPQWFQFHEAHQWLTSEVGKTMFSHIQPVEVPFLEEYFVLFDGKFAGFFFKRILTEYVTNLATDWGPGKHNL